MDPREIILRTPDNSHLKMLNCCFENNILGEFWDVTYEYQDTEFSFTITINERHARININWKDIDLKTQKDKRIVVSYIVYTLKKNIEESSLFRLRILFEGWKFPIYDKKYLINDTENFEKRKIKSFINENKKKILFSYHKALNHARKGWRETAYNADYFMAIKEEDELPLMDFLLENSLMKHVATFEDEEILKLPRNVGVEHHEFFIEFTKEMNKLGYNLYYDMYEGDEGYQREYDYNDYYLDYHYETDCENFISKKNRNNKNKSNRKNNY